MRKSLFLLVVVALVLGTMLPAVVSAEKPKYTISLLTGTMDNPYWQIVTAWADKAAEMLNVNLVKLAVDVEGVATQQISQVEDRVAQGDDAIVIAVQETKALIPAIEAANKAGIPVIAVDKAAEGGKFESIIMTDNVAASYDGGKWVAEQIGGKGKVLVLEGVPGGQTAIDRKTGAHKALSEYPDIQIISLTGEWQTAKAQAVTEDVLTANPDLAGIFASNDMMAIGAVTALNAANINIPVCGFDAIPAALEMVRDGRLGATIAQFPGKMGFLGVEYAVRVIEGEKVPEFVNSGSMPVTKDNVLAFQAGLYGY
jgi:ribose transport system substrate-binding protein